MFARTAPQWSSLSSRRALRAVTYSLMVDGRRIISDSVSWAFPSWNWSRLTEIFLCHACRRVSRASPSWNRSRLAEIYLGHICFCHEFEDGNAGTGESGAPGAAPIDAVHAGVLRRWPAAQVSRPRSPNFSVSVSFSVSFALVCVCVCGARGRLVCERRV
jgi:hypothetical protein